jgi:hypothetical protein
MCIAPATAMVTNQTSMTGPKNDATRAVPRRCTANNAIRNDHRDRQHVVLEGRRHERQALDRREHGNRRL